MTSGVCGKIGKTLGQVEQVEKFNEGRGGRKLYAGTSATRCNTTIV